MTQKIKPIAIYLPQFHPIPENDEWWGKGFTEWTNVTKAKPLFKGHYQPHLPADLGFTDLRCSETRIAQAELAREFGIEGFCYFHYWFKGERILEKPIDSVLKSGEPDFPFCLYWANESWSRTWIGEEKELLIKQEYSAEDDYIHARFLSRVFQDKRYLTVNNRPVFLVFRPKNLPNASATITIFKETVLKETGVEPYIIASNSHGGNLKQFLATGFDAMYNNMPALGVLRLAFNDSFSFVRLFQNIKIHGIADGQLKLYKYKTALKLMIDKEAESFDNIIPSVFVGWDNCPRLGKKGIILTHNTPELFTNELLRTKKKLLASENNSNLLFINAWNEWAEGNHLEPDREYGLKFLEAIRSVFNS